MSFILAMLIGSWAGPVSAASYTKSTADCQSCKAIDAILGGYNGAVEATDKTAYVLKLARVIKSISLKGKSMEAQKREIYFSINASIEVLSADFDSETILKLMDLRAQNPAAFDEVFWHFPVGQQKRIIERMLAAKADKLRPKAEIPATKQLD